MYASLTVGAAVSAFGFTMAAASLDAFDKREPRDSVIARGHRAGGAKVGKVVVARYLWLVSRM